MLLSLIGLGPDDIMFVLLFYSTIKHSVTYDFLRYINILTYLHTYLKERSCVLLCMLQKFANATSKFVTYLTVGTPA